jgi:hypothetical protein
LRPVIGLLRLVGIMNAAVWFGAAIFLTFFAAPTLFSPVLKKDLGEVWPGVIAAMLLERYFVIQYFCSIIALVHAFTEWIYLGKPLHKPTMIVLTTITLFVFAGGLWLEPKMKALHEVKYGYGRHGVNTPVEQREQAGKSFSTLHGFSSTLNLIAVFGIAFYVWRLAAPPNGPRFVPTSKFRS